MSEVLGVLTGPRDLTGKLMVRRTCIPATSASWKTEGGPTRSRPLSPLTVARQARAEQANEVIRAIADHGYHHLRHDGFTAYFEVDCRGVVWFHDYWTHARIYTAHFRGHWHGFTGGGTLESLCRALATFIRTGEPIGRLWFVAWPEGCARWGPLMERDLPLVRERVALTGAVEPFEESVNAAS